MFNFKTFDMIRKFNNEIAELIGTNQSQLEASELIVVTDSCTRLNFFAHQSPLN